MHCVGGLPYLIVSGFFCLFLPQEVRIRNTQHVYIPKLNGRVFPVRFWVFLFAIHKWICRGTGILKKHDITLEINPIFRFFVSRRCGFWRNPLVLGVAEGQGEECLMIERIISGLYSLNGHSIVFAKFRRHVVFVFKKFGQFTQVF